MESIKSWKWGISKGVPKKNLNKSECYIAKMSGLVGVIFIILLRKYKTKTCQNDSTLHTTYSMHGGFFIN